MVRIGSRHLEKKKKKLKSFSNASTEAFKCMQLSCALFEVSMFTFLFFGFRCNGKLVETMFSKRSCPKTRRLSRLTYIKICELIEDGIKFNATTDTCFQITNLSLNMFLIWSGVRSWTLARGSARNASADQSHKICKNVSSCWSWQCWVNPNCHLLFLIRPPFLHNWTDWDSQVAYHNTHCTLQSPVLLGFEIESNWHSSEHLHAFLNVDLTAIFFLHCGHVTLLPSVIW